MIRVEVGHGNACVSCYCVFINPSSARSSGIVGTITGPGALPETEQAYITDLQEHYVTTCFTD